MALRKKGQIRVEVEHEGAGRAGLALHILL